MPKKKTESQTFEDAFKELESLVATLEQGELSLEESLQAFERGVQLTRNCQLALKEAEQKIEILSDQSPQAELEPFQPDE